MSVDSGTDDATLARRAAGGCVASFATLARRHQVPVVHYVRQLSGGSRGDAEDVAQETFLRAWQHIAAYEPRWTFSTWLFTIARRTWLNATRAARRRVRRETAIAVRDAENAIGGGDAAAVAIAAERATRLWRVATNELSERELTSLWMRYVEDKSLDEIALVLDKPASTVKVILFRARRRLEPFVRGEAWNDC